MWPDPTWQAALTDLVVRPADDDDDDNLGFLRAATVEADGKPTVGIVNLDGESVTLEAAEILIPHPALLPDLDDLREFAAELGIEQSFNQLQREVHPLPDPLPEATVTSLHDWAGAEFEQLRFAMGRATGAGFAVKGGYAVARIHEGGRLVEASYWIGADYPEGPTWTEDLSWMVTARSSRFATSARWPTARACAWPATSMPGARSRRKTNERHPRPPRTRRHHD